ncbi:MULTISPECIES: riboflavin synthase [Caproicibacterium]|uniref:Riboflavin synthase n=1 Tax=Caproicibacterium argilliputei TaxID=3030016 RepID=A0AA97D7C5_9FIRM|nr:riboflavin synthase [Caproicibacterium argilliputei]WOC31616.1 riboflavin synthase [Caproicibacterium argilliputei]
MQEIRHGAASLALSVCAAKVPDELQLGDSVAVNGVCLTVTERRPDGFTADVVHETLLYTALGRLHRGSRVNLERALPVGGRLGGHLVAGHIDGTGTVLSVRRDGSAVWYIIRCDAALLRYLVKKGSVTVDGVSLTVAEVSGETFSVSVIPHTAASTTLSERRAGDLVNVETDCVGKYIEKLLGLSAPESGVTQAYLKKFGF